MIRLLLTRRGESRGGRRRKRQRVLSEYQKLVDPLLRSLHNLVSLLLMQRRKTEAPRALKFRERSLKTNSR